MKFFIALSLLLALTSASMLKNMKEAHYAVLIAGSNGFYNYRHQADICHAYHLLLKNGMPADHIIVFAYDDIANSDSNPFKGKVFNKPDPNGKGVDVYKGCKLDYTGSNVTPENFLAVLTGADSQVKGKGTGRVLESSSSDNLFVYFADHGAPGLIAFPDSQLYANDLIKALKQMKAKKMYNRFVFYIEACESGSMFQKILPAELGIYAVTAANPDESSWAAYCSPDDKVNGKSIGSCLGDEFSVRWMENSDAEKSPENLSQQFETVKKQVKGSHVQKYGDFDYVKDDIKDYQGNQNENKLIKKIISIKIYVFKMLFKDESLTEDEEYRLYLENAKKSIVNARDVKIKYLYEQHLQGVNSDLFRQELLHRKKVNEIFKKFDRLHNVNREESIENETTLEIFPCLKNSIENYKAICKTWSEYSLKYVRNIFIACKNGTSAASIKTSFQSIC